MPGPEAPIARDGPHEPAGRSPGAWALLAVVTLAGLAADLASKWAAFKWVADGPVRVVRDEVLAAGPARLGTLIPAHEPVVVVPHVLNLQLLLNSGAVFGAGQGRRMVFILFTMAALAFACFMFARWTERRDRVSHAAIGLIIAGGLGNLYDRVVFACVRDFLHPLPTARLPFGLRWPGGDPMVWPYVSNVADAFLLIGIGVLLVKLWSAGGPADDQSSKGGSMEPASEESAPSTNTRTPSGNDSMKSRP